MHHAPGLLKMHLPKFTLSKLPQDQQNLTVLIAHPLVVDEPDVLLQAGVQQVHVVRLRLDRVGEEAEGLVAHQAVHGHLLHAEDHRGLRDVLLDYGAGRAVGLWGQQGLLSEMLINFLCSCQVQWY